METEKLGEERRNKTEKISAPHFHENKTNVLDGLVGLWELCLYLCVCPTNTQGPACFLRP